MEKKTGVRAEPWGITANEEPTKEGVRGERRGREGKEKKERKGGEREGEGERERESERERKEGGKEKETAVRSQEHMSRKRG